MEQTLTSADTVAALREAILASTTSWPEDAPAKLRELHDISLRFRGWPAKVPALVNHCQFLRVESFTAEQAASELAALRVMVETPAETQAKVDAKKPEAKAASAAAGGSLQDQFKNRTVDANRVLNAQIEHAEHLKAPSALYKLTEMRALVDLWARDSLTITADVAGRAGDRARPGPGDERRRAGRDRQRSAGTCALDTRHAAGEGKRA
jgi:hypothetical protein